MSDHRNESPGSTARVDGASGADEPLDSAHHRIIGVLHELAEELPQASDSEAARRILRAVRAVPPSEMKFR